MSTTTRGTTSETAAPWSDFPEYEKMWEAFVDLFWGNGGDTSFHDMLEEDIEWLKKAYLQNNESLTRLESNYINELEGSQIPLRFGGGPTLNLLPKSSKFIAGERLDVGKDQAKRITDYAEDFTPNRANREYMEYLKSLGTEGQNLRMGLPTTTEEIDEDTGFWETLGSVVDTGTGVYNLGDRFDLWDSIGEGIGSLWDTFGSSSTPTSTSTSTRSYWV